MPTIDRYVTPLKIPMPVDLFWRLPQLSAYKAEYYDGAAVLTYRPKLCMARLPVSPRKARSVEDVSIALLDPVRRADEVIKLFAASFGRVPPLDAMAPTTRRHAAEAAIKHTASGGDGAVFLPACFAAMDAGDGELIGVVIVTEIGLRADEWPDETLPTRLFNLTWLFVDPDRRREQIASALLDRVVNALAAQKMPWLVSHILEDNAPSVLFHWSSGFAIVPAIVRR